MIKILLTSGAFCSLLFAGIADDIGKEDVLPKDIQEINKLINDLNSECKKINYYTIGYDKEGITLQQLENFYDSASATKLEVEKINKQYKERIIKFYNSYDAESFRIQKIYDKLAPANHDGHWHDYNYIKNKMSISELCPEIDNLDDYKANIKNTYLELKSIQEKAENEAKMKAEFEAKIAKVNEIITNKLMSQLGDIQKNYSIADYDAFLKTARDTWDELETFKDDDGKLLVQNSFDINYAGNLRTYDEYVNEVQRQKAYKQKQIESNKQNQKNIPAYKKWKTTTVPKFQKNLKVGDYVIGGIIWKVDGNLVVVDTGAKGLISQQRNQIYPRVPQDLMPLYLNEIYGVAKY